MKLHDRQVTLFFSILIWIICFYSPDYDLCDKSFGTCDYPVDAIVLERKTYSQTREKIILHLGAPSPTHSLSWVSSYLIMSSSWVSSYPVNGTMEVYFSCDHKTLVPYQEDVMVFGIYLCGFIWNVKMFVCGFFFLSQVVGYIQCLRKEKKKIK